MPTFSLKEASQQLSRLMDAAARGESVVITRDGQQVAELRALPPTKARQRLPDLTAFRATLPTAPSLTDALLAQRDEERA